MTRYTDQLAQLQERYRAQKGIRPLKDVAPEMGLSTLTLARFERGHFVSPIALHQVAQWVLHQERARDLERGR